MAVMHAWLACYHMCCSMIQEQLSTVARALQLDKETKPLPSHQTSCCTSYCSPSENEYSSTGFCYVSHRGCKEGRRGVGAMLLQAVPGFSPCGQGSSAAHSIL